ncbi:hypothetical protein J6590_027121 [Homalodisca vitripennis]|nr:hypothetical protein J6590_027121 [Homalodisca vitripennis]
MRHEELHNATCTDQTTGAVAAAARVCCSHDAARILTSDHCVCAVIIDNRPPNNLQTLAFILPFSFLQKRFQSSNRLLHQLVQTEGEKGRDRGGAGRTDYGPTRQYELSRSTSDKSQHARILCRNYCRQKLWQLGTNHHDGPASSTPARQVPWKWRFHNSFHHAIASCLFDN